jgi:predicted amidohydrolase
MQVHLVQHDIAWEDAASTRARVASLIATASPPPGGLVVLPEMFATGFSMNTAATLDRDGVTRGFCRDLARSSGCHVLAGLVERTPDGAGAHNVALLHAPGGSLVARYAKIHLFHTAEAKHYAPGDAIAVADVAGVGVGISVCYDLRFPELYRVQASRGAEVMAVIANWPSPRNEHWVTLLRARAIENQCYVLGVNRVGRDPQATYVGRSLVVDPKGEIVADAGDREGVVSVSLDLPVLRAWREKFPALASRRLSITETP